METPMAVTQLPAVIPGRVLVAVGTTDPVEIGSFDVPLSLPAPSALLGDGPVRIAVDMDGYRANLAAVLRAAAATVETVEPATDPS
jgi:hypothetical protein